MTGTPSPRQRCTAAMGGEVVRERGLEAQMTDGVTLVADAWHPAAGAAWPVLLQRLPYGRAVASTPVLPHPAWFARRGYAVVVQDVRGRGDSGGVFEPFVHEAADGLATVEWAARLPFADGRVAMYGFSYQGLCQLYAAAQRPPSLQAIAPMMCCPDPYESWTYEGGIPRWSFLTAWATQLATQVPGAGTVSAALEALPITAALGESAPSFFLDWLAHERDDAYWQARRPELARITVPVFSALGYFDDFATGTSRLIDALGAEAVCGPWQHMPWGTRFGSVELGPEASATRVAEALIAFFNRVFNGGSTAMPRVSYYSGGRGWRSVERWPPPRLELWWAAASGGNANSRHGDGVLESEPAAGELRDVLVSEPLSPYRGGGDALSEEAASEDRRDVLCYTTSQLDDPLSLVGMPRVELRLRADRPSVDLVASLVLVERNGDSRRLATGARRLAGLSEAAETEVEFELSPIAWHCERETRLRLDLSGARFPLYARNPQADIEPRAQATRHEHLIATIEVCAVRLVTPVEATAVSTASASAGLDRSRS